MVKSLPTMRETRFWSLGQEDLLEMGMATHSSIFATPHKNGLKEIFQRRQWHPTPVLLPGKSHGQRSLVSCSPWGHEESDTTERLHFPSLEKEMATHSSVLAWRNPGMAEPGRLPSAGLHRIGHDWSNLAAASVVYLVRSSIVYFFYIYILIKNSSLLKVLTVIWAFSES